MADIFTLDGQTLLTRTTHLTFLFIVVIVYVILSPTFWH